MACELAFEYQCESLLQSIGEYAEWAMENKTFAGPEGCSYYASDPENREDATLAD